MKLYFLAITYSLFLIGCTQQKEIPSWEERVAAAEEKLSESSALPNQDASDPSSELRAEDLSLKDDQQVFEKYLPTLMFHYIEDLSPDSADQIRYGLSFSPQKLEAFLNYFKENNIKTLTYKDLVEILNGEKIFPEKAVMLTFDDGYDDHYSEAFRLLKKYDMKGVFFIISDKPDQDPQYATWAQIKEMTENGQEIASHTVSHPSLSTLSSEDLKKELQDSKKTLEAKIGQPVISLAYPSGDYNEAVLQATKEIYTFARTTHSGKDFSLQNRYELPTVRIFPETGVASLKAWFEDGQ